MNLFISLRSTMIFYIFQNEIYFIILKSLINSKLAKGKESVLISGDASINCENILTFLRLIYSLK